ncbi:MAG TPA: murein biosynthesis integral membrane protein MurJ [Phycisphaerae bacterium]|nr:murein biosynthesis integral membrane protein MurJ [Phycisphaerae bacterium]HPS53307.1 murein biosynthesis integral membrane protein MurJ [Phycisphaerae bacterium]
MTAKEQDKFFSAARMVAFLTLASRILGLIRDMIMVPLGSPVMADRFWTAFGIPNLFRRLFGEGALSSAFVPVYTEVCEAKGMNRARLVLANVAGILAIILCCIILLVSLGLWAWWEICGGDYYRLVLLQFTGIMLPFMFTICMLALGSAALNCRGHFAYPAFAPLILNVGMIITAKCIAPAICKTDIGQFYVYCVSVVVSGVVQLVGVVWLLKKSGLAALANFRPILPETKEIGRLMLPMLVPISILQFSAFADWLIALKFTATPDSPNLPLTDGTVRCLYAANRLYQMPMGVLAISIATVVFPLFSRYASRNDRLGLKDATNRALRLSLFLGIPSGLALIIMARPIIELLFQRKNFLESDTIRTAHMLQAYSVGMWAYFCNHILLRAFYAIKQPRKPLQIACGLVCLNLALVICGIFTPLKGSAIGLATAITSSANTVLLIWFLRKQVGLIGFRKILKSLAKITVASSVMVLGILAAMYGTEQIPLQHHVTLSGIIKVVAGVAGGMACYFITAFALKSPELPEIIKRRAA